MSTAPIPQPPAETEIIPDRRELFIYSHSHLFYWWPVWAIGFLMAVLTWFEGSRMAVVPPDTKAVAANEADGDKLIVPKGEFLPRDADGKISEPHLRMSQSRKLGVIYATVLLLVIFVSNVPLRGLWSVLILLGVLLFILICSLAGAWDWIVTNWRLIDIRINMGGYLFISVILFIIWAVTVFIFDHRSYVVVTPGQVRVCLAVGAGEAVYDTTGIIFKKQQNDLFRHWIIGLGSGDLIIPKSNTHEEIDMPNVLFIGSKIKEIEQLIKERKVV
jgi:hypothetical protein